MSFGSRFRRHVPHVFRFVKGASWATCLAIGFLVILMVISSTCMADETQLMLAQEGKSDYVIVLPAEPAVTQQTAANELQTHLKQVTGVELPIISEADLTGDKAADFQGRPQIVIGPSARMKALLPDVDVTKLGSDAIILKTIGKDLVLAGQLPRGPLYAAYTFLEDSIGIRWWSPTESLIPNYPTLIITAPDLTYNPPFFYRETLYHAACNDGVYATRLRLNGGLNYPSNEYGGHYQWAAFVHTFYPFLPPEKYFKDHPEWYSQNAEGKRFHEYGQLCLTNDEMRAEFTKNVLQGLRDNPNAKLISISQNDWHGRCECEKCKAIEEEEGSPSGLMLRFVNQVAEAVEKEFPDVKVSTLAYQYTRKPPKFARPRDNVVIRLCSIECCFAHPLATDEHNQDFREDIEGWKKITPRLFVWDYVTNFVNVILPHPNLNVLAPNIRFFRDNNVVGLFEQGDGYCRSGDFVRLRQWLIGHLLWNPDLDEQALIREFVEGYYGPAAPHILAYLKVINDAGHDSEIHLGCFRYTTADWLPLEQLNEATRLMNQAQAAVVGNEPFAERVRRERLPLDHDWIKRFSDPARLVAKAEGKSDEGPKDKAVAILAFLDEIKHFDVKKHQEWGPIEPYLESLRMETHRHAATPPELCKSLAPSDWLDISDDGFTKSKQGEWTFVEQDPKSSDGLTVRMPGSHHEWALCWRLPATWDGTTSWRCYAVVRADVKAEAKATDEVAIQIGIYDEENHRGVMGKNVPCRELADGEYHTIDLGARTLNGGMYFWFAPPWMKKDVPSVVDNVYVDRIFLVREK